MFIELPDLYELFAHVAMRQEGEGLDLMLLEDGGIEVASNKITADALLHELIDLVAVGLDRRVRQDAMGMGGAAVLERNGHS